MITSLRESVANWFEVTKTSNLGRKREGKGYLCLAVLYVHVAQTMGLSVSVVIQWSSVVSGATTPDSGLTPESPRMSISVHAVHIMCHDAES